MPQPIQIIITIDPGAGIRVDGPIDDPVLAFGILEAAKLVVIDRIKQNEKRVQPVSILPPGVKLQ